MTDDTKLATALLVTPSRPLPIGKNWQLHLSPGLPNAALDAVTANAHSRRSGSVDGTAVSTINALTRVDQPRRIEITFNKGIDRALTPEDLRQFITLTPEPPGLGMGFHNGRRLLIINGDFSERSSWPVEVKAGLPGEDGLALEEAVTETAVFEHLPPRVATASHDEAQLSTGRRQYPIETVNLSSLRVRVKQVAGEDAVRAFQGYRHYTGDGPDRSTIKPTGPVPFELIRGTVLTDQVHRIDRPLDTSHHLNLAWDELLPEATPYALLFVSLEGTPHAGLAEKSKPVITQSFVQLTDLGLAWKVSDEEAFVYAYSCQTGTPLPHVRLDVFGEDGESIHSFRTGPDGVARLPRDEAGRHLRASWGEDSYLTAFDSTLSTLSMWRFPVRFAWDYERETPRHVFLFTDRNLYRPGETVHLKGLVRLLEEDRFTFDAKDSPRLTVRDSARRIIHEQDVTLSPQGSFDLSLPLPAETVGRFHAELSWPDELEALSTLENWNDRYAAEQNAKFTHSFQVDEFRRNAFEVKSTLTGEETSRSLKLTLDANYYQGQPVAEGTVDWFLTANSTGFYPDGYRDFLFGDHRSYDRYYWSHYFGYDDDDHYGSRRHTSNGTAALDAEGQAVLDLELPEEDFPSPRKVTVTSEVTDARNQILSTRASHTVHSSRVYLGVSRQDQLIRAGEDLELRLVAVQTDGKPASDPLPARLTITREYNEQTKVKTKDGRVAVRNTTHTEELGEQELIIDPANASQGGQPLVFHPEKPGKHTLVFSGKDRAGNAFRTATILHVYGPDSYPWAFESGIKIKLVPEKRSYKPGETARILVLSPIEGTALITLERRNVQQHFVRELRADNPVIEIPVTEENAPNVFASVLVIKGASDNLRKVKEPILRLGYCELEVENVAERLAVSLDVPGEPQRPGEEVTVSGRLTTASGDPVPNGEVTLYVEDEGTLAVMGYRTPRPMAYFFAPRQLHTRAGTSLGSFLTESGEDLTFYNKGFFIGGGEDAFAAGGIGGPDAPLPARTNFDPCAFWAPALQTDTDGSFRVSFPTPDTLTRYRVIAIAHQGADHFGSGTAELTVDKPIMLEPSVPRFAHEGDTLHPKVLVQNGTDHHGTWKVTLELDSITRFLEGEPRIQSKTITLPPHGSQAVSFDVALSDTGMTDWSWSIRPASLSGEGPPSEALQRDLSDAVVSRFEVNYPMPLLRETHFVRFEEGRQDHDLLRDHNAELLRGRGELELEFGKSLLLEAGDAIEHLLHYPYGCVEQTTSSTIPWIAALNLRGLSPVLDRYSESEIRSSMQAGANRLLSMQTRDGGLAYWPGGREPEEWASAYGGMALLLCKEAGAKVPDEAIESLAKYLESTLGNIASREDDWQRATLCRSLFVLSMAGRPQHAVHHKLLDRAGTLGNSGRLFLALALHSTGDPEALKQATTLLDHPAQPDDTQSGWMRYGNDDALRLLATSRIRPTGAEAILDKLLAGRSEKGHWRTTWCNAWAVYAIGDYAGRSSKLDDPVTVTLVTTEGTRNFTLDRANPSAALKLPLGSNLQARVSSDGPLYVRSRLASKPARGAQPPHSQGGFKIARSYHRVFADGSSEPLQNPQVGDLIRVDLVVDVPGDNSRYLVIDDPLPSLFETVNTEFSSQAGRVAKKHTSWNISHQELRDDRAVFFVDHLWSRGSYRVQYHARVTSAGHAVAPPAKIEAMYDPGSYALTASREFKTPDPLQSAAR